MANSQLLNPTGMGLLKIKGRQSVSSDSGVMSGGEESNSNSPTETISTEHGKSAFQLTNGSAFVPVTSEAQIKLQHSSTATTTTPNIASLSNLFDGMVTASPGLADRTLKDFSMATLTSALSPTMVVIRLLRNSEAIFKLPIMHCTGIILSVFQASPTPNLVNQLFTPSTLSALLTDSTLMPGTATLTNAVMNELQRIQVKIIWLIVLGMVLTYFFS